MIGMSQSLYGAMSNMGKGLRNVAIGAAVGGVMGGMSDRGTFAGGAIGGAVGGAAFGRLSRFGAGRNLAGLGQRGMGMLGAGAAKLRPLARNYGNLPGVGSFGVRGVAGLSRFATAGGAAMGRNSASINRYGGYALGALGVGAAAQIGSSMLSSNRGY